MPRFSIIVPVYNVEPWLTQCLDSLLGQTYTDFEAICVDDGSTDGSGVLADSYATRDPHIKAIHRPNGGLSAARNTGLDHACGEYILFLDSDDYLQPDTLQVLNSHLGGEDLLCFSGRRFDDATGAYHPSDPLTPATYATGMDYYHACALLPRDFAFVCVVLRCYRRAFLENHHLRFREGILHEDNLFTPQVCYHAQRVKVIPDALYNYRLRPGSITSARSLRSRQSTLLIANELSAFFTSKPSIDRSIVYRLLTQHYQMAFSGATRAERRTLRPLVDWPLYRTVSRNRLRHRLNYLLLRYIKYLYSS
ncbi:MAG: glycosyltransferase [Bacteroidales bacterium]|nr:glycosyltransferase [Bacteroidales bacterium]